MNSTAAVKKELRGLFANPEQEVAVWWRVVAPVSRNGMWHPCSMHQCSVSAIYHTLNLAFDYQAAGVVQECRQRGEACVMEFRILAAGQEVVIATPTELDFVFESSLNPRGRKPTPSNRLKAVMAEAVPT